MTFKAFNHETSIVVSKSNFTCLHEQYVPINGRYIFQSANFEMIYTSRLVKMNRIGCVIPNMIQLFVRSKTFDTPCLWSKLNVEITKRVECILFLLLYYILCRPTAVFHFGFGLTKQCLGGCYV